MRPEVTALVSQALRYPHVAVSRVEVWFGGVRVDTGGLDILGGQVKIDATAKIRRQLTTEVPATDANRALLAPPGTELRPYRGVLFPSGQEVMVPLGRLEVDTQRMGYSPAGNLSVSAGDAWGRVQASEFLQPGVSEFGTVITTQLATFLQQALPDVSLVSSVSASYVIGAKVWETDRAGAIEEMVEALGAELFFDAVGNAVLRPVPQLTGTPVWTVDASSSGVLIDADREQTNQRTRNIVIASAAAVDGVPGFDPVYVWDNDPGSPTYAGPDPVSNPGAAGPFGIRPARITSPLISTTEQAIQAATAALAKLSGAGHRLSLTAAVNPGLEPGDTIAVQLPPDPERGTRTIEAHLVDSVTVPLTVRDAQQITTRAFGPQA